METKDLVEIVEDEVKSKREFIYNDVSVIKVVLQKISSNKEKVQMIDATSGKHWSAKQMHDSIVTLALQLMEIGIKKGDCVAFYAPNSDIHAIMLLAVWSIGAIYSGCMHTNPYREIYNVVVDSGSKFLISCKQNIETCALLMQEVQTLKKVFLIDSEVDDRGFISVPKLLQNNTNVKGERMIDELLSKSTLDDLIKINFSSGTTGRPKATSLRNRNLLAVLAIASEGFEIVTPNDTVAINSHFGHAGGTLMLAAALLQGSKIIVFANFDPSAYISWVEKYDITCAMFVPSLINLLCKAVSHPYKNFSLKKVLITGEVLSSLIADDFISKFNPSYFGQTFGSTEMGFSLVKPISEGITNVSTVGIPAIGFKAKIIEMGSERKLKANKIGEIRVKGPQLTLGYLNNEKANKESFDEEGFFKTGDLGYYSDDGHFYFTDRLLNFYIFSLKEKFSNRFKEIIKYNSLQVSPSELEGILFEHEAVKEAAVIGIPDSNWGQLPKAFVVLKEQKKDSVTENELIEFVSKKVAEYKRLRGGVVFLPQLPKSILGKIDKKALKLA
ncbi:hypothetical protein B4U79_02702 [Dinothrombium tinctorium]|uniref:Uncharacterized protein n=1 Tax=Dinothrombium tinctorium TaxID=1965070 RepID=A0A3S3SHQ3_9ACAR|nr:hypothetical protein B4U79_02702 [Dinothrombium tinctorium]